MHESGLGENRGPSQMPPATFFPGLHLSRGPLPEQLFLSQLPCPLQFLRQLQASLCSQEQSYFLGKVKRTNENRPLYQPSGPDRSCCGWHSQGWSSGGLHHSQPPQGSLRAPILTQRAARPWTPWPYLIGLAPPRAGSPSLDSCPRP